MPQYAYGVLGRITNRIDNGVQMNSFAYNPRSEVLYAFIYNGWTLLGETVNDTEGTHYFGGMVLSDSLQDTWDWMAGYR